MMATCETCAGTLFGKGSPPQSFVEMAERGEGDLTIFGNDKPIGWVFVEQNAHWHWLRDKLIEALNAQGRVKAARTFQETDLEREYFTFNINKAFLVELAARLPKAPTND
jgi:hypothetical protein